MSFKLGNITPSTFKLQDKDVLRIMMGGIEIWPTYDGTPIPTDPTDPTTPTDPVDPTDPTDPVLTPGYLSVSIQEMNFGQTVLNEAATSQVTLTNTGGDRLSLVSVDVTGAGYTSTGTCGSFLDPGGTCSIAVTFTPTAESVYNGNLRITTSTNIEDIWLIGAGSTSTTSITLSRLSTSGNQIIKEDGTPERLHSVNWFGAESPNNFPHGIWLRSYKAIIDQIKSMGFNCIRMPFSGDTFKAGSIINGVDADQPDNMDFVLSGSAIEPENIVWKTPFECMDIILDYCEAQGLYVVMDHHRRAAGAGADGEPTDALYTEQDWIATWQTVAQRYKDRRCVIGADVHNEPHNLTWDVWATLAENCGNAIHAIAPDWLIFVEGVGVYNDTSYWWGGNLIGVSTRPVVLTVPNKLVYSPHEYGQSVATQAWLRYDSDPSLPLNYPNNLYAIWREHWGFIFEDNIAPLWIGEFGGFFGIDGLGGATKPHATYETQWMTELVKYYNGDFNGDGVRELEAGKKGISFAFWSYNPNSGDTGGLVQDDWTTPQTHKLDILAPALTTPSTTPTEPTVITVVMVDPLGNLITDSAGNAWIKQI